MVVLRTSSKPNRHGIATWVVPKMPKNKTTWNMDLFWYFWGVFDRGKNYREIMSLDCVLFYLICKHDGCTSVELYNFLFDSAPAYPI